MNGTAQEGLAVDANGAGPSAGSWDGSTVVSAFPLIDRFESEAGTVVMVEAGAAHRIARLSVLGREVLDAVGERATLGSLEHVILERLGPPPDDDLWGAVQHAVRELAEAGLLNVTPSAPDVTGS
jgi:hypothetical protein